MPIVLVVDDSAVDRRVVEGLLAREGGLDWLIEYAENGVRALEIMGNIRCDVVVTDLQMPEMDGLELVETMQRRYPDVPVILATGKGSEAVALEALDRGAASYVPKQRLAERLVGTIEQVVATAKASVRHKRLFQSITKIQVEFNLHSDATLVRPLVDDVEQILSDISFRDHADRIQMGVALEEALINAIFHGNLELTDDQAQEARVQLSKEKPFGLVDERLKKDPYQNRNVRIALAINHQEARFVIRDDGPGFAPDAVPQRGDPRTMQTATGRGLVLIQNFMDEVAFNEQRNQITLVKRAKPQSG